MKVDFHFAVSMIKSVVRIAGCVFLINGAIVTAGIMLLIAEMLGIVEEL